MESFVVPANRPFNLPLAFDVCGCCAETQCAVAVDVAARTLRLTTRLCPDPCDCDGCVTPVASCALPPLAEGQWVVEVNGGAALSVPVVRDEPGLLPVPPACVDFAEADACTGAAALEGHLERVTRACVQRDPGAFDRYEIELSDECGTCDRESTCRVEVHPRLTDDLPPGSDVRVRALRYAGACDGACPEICMPHSRTCAIPPLDPEGFHRVIVEGGPTFTFTGGEPGPVCSD